MGCQVVLLVASLQLRIVKLKNDETFPVGGIQKIDGRERGETIKDAEKCCGRKCASWGYYKLIADSLFGENAYSGNNARID